MSRIPFVKNPTYCPVYVYSFMSTYCPFLRQSEQPQAPNNDYMTHPQCRPKIQASVNCFLLNSLATGKSKGGQAQLLSLETWAVISAPLPALWETSDDQPVCAVQWSCPALSRKSCCDIPVTHRHRQALASVVRVRLSASQR